MTVLQDILRDAGRRDVPAPTAAILELTRKCNLACRHCYAVPEKGRRELSREELCRTLDDLKDLGALFLTFCGGDPTVNRDFLPIVRHASERKFVVQFFSNGLLIDEEAAEELAACNVFHAGISLYGATAEVHDDITRRRGSHAKTVRAARLLKERGVHVVFKFIAMNRNAHEAWAAAEMAASMGIPIRVDAVITARDDRATDTIGLQATRDQHRRLLKAFETDGFAPMPVDRGGNRDLSCGMGKTLLSINAYGDVFPCVTLPIPAGNVRYAPLAEIWSSSPLLAELRSYPRADRLGACGGCGSRGWCNRCPGNTFTETGDLYGPSPTACREAVVRRGLWNEARGIDEEIPLPPGLDESHLPGWTAADLAEAAGCAASLRSAVDD